MTRSVVKQWLPLPSAIRTAAWFTILTVPAAVAAYYRIFSGFAEWDDEGTLMMQVRQYLTGSKLYDQIYSGYGPVYFYYNRLVRLAAGSVLNHNGVRIISAVVSLLCMLVCAWIVLRLTKSLAAASLAQLLVFRGLRSFTNEPGHPQELCMLLLVCLAGSGILAANPRRLRLSLAASGSIAAALTLVKVNIGIFAILAVALAILFQSPPAWLWRAAKLAVGGAAFLLPFALMRVHLNDPAAQAYCVVVTASVAGVLAGAYGVAKAGTTAVRECLLAATGFAVTFALALLVLVWQGVSLQATFNALIMNQVRMNVSPGFWYGAVELSRFWIAWAMAGLGGAVLSARAQRSGKENLYRLMVPFQVLFGSAALLIALIVPGLLLGFVTPFCWLLLFPRAYDGPPRHVYARVLLSAATVLQTLTAYPFAGSQTYFLRVLLMLVAVISLFDGLHSLSQQAGLAPMFRRFARPAAAVTLAAVALAYPVFAYRANRLYASLTPLDLPGAERIHVEKAEAEDYQWLVTHLRQNCDTFVSLPGIPSLYFWTGKPLPGRVDQPPGPLNMDQWMDLFTAAQQQAIADDFSRHPGACAVYHPSGVDFWNTGHHDVRGWPLANYILTHFKTIGQSGDYQFMVRSERQLDIPAGVRRELRRQKR
jgi:hypothetical protein